MALGARRVAKQCSLGHLLKQLLDCACDLIWSRLAESRRVFCESCAALELGVYRPRFLANPAFECRFDLVPARSWPGRTALSGSAQTPRSPCRSERLAP